jgi:hypothetical protein
MWKTWESHDHAGAQAKQDHEKGVEEAKEGGHVVLGA